MLRCSLNQRASRSASGGKRRSDDEKSGNALSSVDVARSIDEGVRSVRSGSSLGPLQDAVRAIITFIGQHQGIALGLVVGLEEAGLPLPIPGDIFILYAGYLVGIHRLDFWPTCLYIMVTATIGASILFFVGRKVGSGFLLRHGHIFHVNAERLIRMRRLIRRYGALIIIFGRYVPGLRIVLTVVAGALYMPYPIFAGSVLVSSFVWAFVLLNVGERLGRQVLSMLTVDPVHIIPGALLLLVLIAAGVVVWRGAHQDRARRRDASASMSTEAALEGDVL